MANISIDSNYSKLSSFFVEIIKSVVLQQQFFYEISTRDDSVTLYKVLPPSRQKTVKVEIQKGSVRAEPKAGPWPLLSDSQNVVDSYTCLPIHT